MGSMGQNHSGRSKGTMRLHGTTMTDPEEIHGLEKTTVADPGRGIHGFHGTILCDGRHGYLQ